MLKKVGTYLNFPAPANNENEVNVFPRQFVEVFFSCFSYDANEIPREWSSISPGTQHIITISSGE